MLSLFFAPWIALAPPSASTSAGDPGADAEADLSEASRLFDEGVTRYEAADYEAAIEVFTQALSALRDQGVSEFRIRGLLLFNIGRAHVSAYEIDRDLEHLRQAQAILRSFVKQAETEDVEQVSAEDVAEAKRELENIEAMLTKAEEDVVPAPVVNPAVDQPKGYTEAEIRRTRGIGIGLTVTGVALVGTGVGLLVWGAGFGPAAQATVDGLDDLGLPEDDPAFDQGEDFVVAERRKGTAWMIGGGVGAALGVVGLAIGAQQLIKAKGMKANQLTATGGFDAHGAYLGISGRF